MDLEQRFKRNLKRLLEGKKQEDVAASTVRFDPEGRGLKQQDISDFKTLKRMPKLDAIGWLAAAFDVDPVELVADSTQSPLRDPRILTATRKLAEKAAQDPDVLHLLETLVATVKPR